MNGRFSGLFNSRRNRPQMTRMQRMCADLIREYPPNPFDLWSIAHDSKITLCHCGFLA
jgi:hypothetical protein